MQTFEIDLPTELPPALARLLEFGNPAHFDLGTPHFNESPVLTVPPGDGDIMLSDGLFQREEAPRSKSAGCSPAMEEVFRGLVRDFGTSLYYFVLKRVGHPDDAADIAQQSFVEAACSLTSYRGEAELSTWIFGIATNLSRNHVNRAPQHRHHFESDDILEGCASPELSPSESLSQREGLALVSDAMKQLPQEMQEALTLIAIDELSYQEAAIELNVPVGTVRSRVSRARAAVRKHLREAGFCSIDA